MDIKPHKSVQKSAHAGKTHREWKMHSSASWKDLGKQQVDAQTHKRGDPMG